MQADLTKPAIEHFGRDTSMPIHASSWWSQLAAPKMLNFLVFIHKFMKKLAFKSREKDLRHKCPMVGFVISDHIHNAGKRKINIDQT